MVSTRASSKRGHSYTEEEEDKKPDIRPAKRRAITASNSHNKDPQTPKAHKVAEKQPIQKKSSPPPKPQSSHPPIYTLGHGTRTLSEVIDLLHSAQVSTLIDVRSFPRSRTNPQFNRDELQSSRELLEGKIDYLWLGRSLGGRRGAHEPGVERHAAIRVAAFRNYAGYMGTEAFGEGLEELKGFAREGSGAVAVMCSETLWWRCHRRMIADALVVGGWEVRHLGVKKGLPMEHVVWEIARVEEGGGLVYDVKG